MKNRILLASTVLALTLLGAAGAQAATITGLFNTGVDGTGTPLAEGATDTHYLVNGTGSPVVYDHPSYVLTPDARFIAVSAGGAYTLNPNTFSLTFDLTGFNVATAQLSGNFESDNYASVFLNGTLIAQDLQFTTVTNFQSLTPFSASSAAFVAGLNTLSFVVTDTGPPSAFLVSGLSGTADLAGGVPEPASWALMLIGFGGLGTAIRSQRKPTAVAA
jgi:hypothetical protein